MPSEENQTLICLIPIAPDNKNLKSFRPIGLCNTIYKLVTKIIMNRIKPILPHLVSPI